MILHISKKKKNKNEIDEETGTEEEGARVYTVALGKEFSLALKTKGISYLIQY